MWIGGANGGASKGRMYLLLVVNVLTTIFVSLSATFSVWMQLNHFGIAYGNLFPRFPLDSVTVAKFLFL